MPTYKCHPLTGMSERVPVGHDVVVFTEQTTFKETPMTTNDQAATLHLLSESGKTVYGSENDVRGREVKDNTAKASARSPTSLSTTKE